MPDNLTLINLVIDAHNTIRNNIKLVGSSVTDLEAIFSLQKADAGWSLGSFEKLTESQGRLLQTLSALEEGLKNHFGMEERGLPPILGETIMLALVLDHKEISGLIDKAKSMVLNTNFERMGQEETLIAKTRIQQSVTEILWKVEDHARKEEMVLKMAQKALESKKT